MKGFVSTRTIPTPILAVALSVAAVALVFSWQFRMAVFAGDMGVKHLQGLTFQSGPLTLPHPGAKYDPEGELFPFEPPVAFETSRGWVSIWLNPMVLLLIPLFDRLLGWSGYFAAPFLGGWLTVHALALLGRELRLPQPNRSAAFVWLCTPLLFYTLVLWEHTLAVGCGLMGLAGLLRSRRKGESPSGPGLWLGASALFRVEAAVAAGLLCLSVWFRRRDRRLPAFLVWGACAVLPPLGWGWAVSLLVEAPATGQIAFPYLSPFSPWTGDDWTPHLVKMLQMLVEPFQDADAAVLTVASILLAPLLLGFSFPKHAQRWAGPALGVLAAGGLLLSLLRWSHELPFHAGIVAACPAMAAVPFLRLPARLHGLRWAWLVGILLLVVIAPNNGGLQRGCRYLLLPCVLGVYWVLSEWPRSRGGVRFLLGAAILLGATIQAAGVHSLWRHKAVKERGFEAILAENPDFLVTNVWYFPQEAGRIFSRLPILWTRTSGDVGKVMRTIETLDPEPTRFIAILPSEASDVAAIDIPNWHGERIEDFGRLPVLSFRRTDAK